MFAIIWRFRPRKDAAASFEAAYGPSGDWAEFFRTGDGYLGTELLRNNDGSYVTIDRWRSAADFERFRERWAGEYALLDRACEVLTDEEALIGRFETVGREEAG
jgi:heme-degrading monooxygenase HmoA